MPLAASRGVGGFDFDAEFEGFGDESESVQSSVEAQAMPSSVAPMRIAEPAAIISAAPSRSADAAAIDIFDGPPVTQSTFDSRHGPTDWRQLPAAHQGGNDGNGGTAGGLNGFFGATRAKLAVLFLALALLAYITTGADESGVREYSPALPGNPALGEKSFDRIPSDRSNSDSIGLPERSGLANLHSGEVPANNAPLSEGNQGMTPPESSGDVGNGDGQEPTPTEPSANPVPSSPVATTGSTLSPQPVPSERDIVAQSPKESDRSPLQSPVSTGQPAAGSPLGSGAPTSGPNSFLPQVSPSSDRSQQQATSSETTSRFEELVAQVGLNGAATSAQTTATQHGPISTGRPSTSSRPDDTQNAKASAGAAERHVDTTSSPSKVSGINDVTLGAAAAEPSSTGGSTSTLSRVNDSQNATTVQQGSTGGTTSFVSYARTMQKATTAAATESSQDDTSSSTSSRLTDAATVAAVVAGSGVQRTTGSGRTSPKQLLHSQGPTLHSDDGQPRRSTSPPEASTAQQDLGKLPASVKPLMKLTETAQAKANISVGKDKLTRDEDRVVGKHLLPPEQLTAKHSSSTTVVSFTDQQQQQKQEQISDPDSIELPKPATSSQRKVQSIRITGVQDAQTETTTNQ